jgi:hypothetical protein
MNNLILWIIVLILLIIAVIIINKSNYFYGTFIGMNHSNKIKSTFTYIDMREYSKNLDNRSFINGYLNGINILRTYN